MFDVKVVESEKCQAAVGNPAGLTSEEARSRLAQFGPNAVSEAVPSRFLRYLAKFRSPIALLLETAMVVEFGLGKYVEAAVIAGLLLFNATLGLIQEERAGAALAALKKRLALTALARRDGEWVKLPTSELVTDSKAAGQRGRDGAMSGSPASLPANCEVGHRPRCRRGPLLR
jgi:magnesium-transporting ATPase (P-type)